MSDRIDPEERRTDIALFRYGLILPLLRGEYEPGGKGRLRELIAASYHEIPHSSRRKVSVPTLARWERRYNQDGFEGLKPKPRSDRGQPRTISSETLDRAEALKRQQPHRSSRSIIKALNMDTTQPVPEETIAPRTLRRQLALRGATAAHLLIDQRPNAYRRFERTRFGDLWQGDAMHGPKLPDPAHPDKKARFARSLQGHSRLHKRKLDRWKMSRHRLDIRLRVNEHPSVKQPVEATDGHRLALFAEGDTEQLHITTPTAWAGQWVPMKVSLNSLSPTQPAHHPTYHLPNLLQQGPHRTGLARRIQPIVAHHLELLRRDMPHHAVDELQHPLLHLMSSPSVILVVEPHPLPIVLHNALVCYRWMPDVAPNVATYPLPLLHPSLGMDVESVGIAPKQPIDQLACLLTRRHDLSQPAQYLVLPHLPQGLIAQKRLLLPPPLFVQAPFRPAEPMVMVWNIWTSV